MKKALFSAVFTLLAFAAMPAFAQDKADKIGYIDLQRIINESKQGKESKELLTKEGEYKGRKLREGDEALKKKFSELDAQRTVLSPDAFQKRQQELMAERDKFTEQVQSYQLDLRKKEQELTQDIVDDVQGLVKDMAQKEGFTLILEKTESGIFYAPEKFDLTERVLQLYDAKKSAADAKKK